MLQDLRFAWRLLRRSPGFVTAAVATLAIGIGATTAIFTLVDAVLLRPLDVPDAGRVVVFQQATRFGTSANFLYTDFHRWQSSATSAGVFTIESSGSDVVETPSGPAPLQTAYVGPQYFDVLQRLPIRGRAFTVQDDRGDAEPVAIISYRYWRTALNGDERVLGSVIRIVGVPFTVVGVAAPGVTGTRAGMSIDLFLPAHAILRTTTLGPGAGNYYFQDGSPGWSPGSWWRIVGRLAPGVRREALAARLAPDHIDPVPLQEAAVAPRVRGDVSRFSTVLFVAVVLVLLIGCANLAGLMMARTEARQRDVAIRLAIGISRKRLVRQLMVESGIVAGAGATAGFVLARWLLAALSSEAMPGFLIPLSAVQFRLDARVVAFSIALAAAAACAFGLTPAVMAAKTDVMTALKQGKPRGRAWGRHVLIAAQIAITLVLLFGAGLFIRSLRVALGVDVGIDTERIAIATPDLRAARYDVTRQAAYLDAAVARLTRLPGVHGATWGTGPFILAGNSTPAIAIDGQSLRLPNNVMYFQGGPAYFRTLGILLSRGRDFAEGDAPGAAPVIVVNAAFARRFWPAGDPLGHRVSVPPVINDALVVGVAEDGKYRSLAEQGRLAVFIPWRQSAPLAFSTAVILRTDAPAAAMTAAIGKEIAALDRAVVAGRVRILRDSIDQLVTPQRFGSWLLGGFATVGLLLGAIGVYGLLSYMIAQRTREIGVRIALGACSRDIARLVVRGVVIALVTGAVAGVGASWWLGRVIDRLLFGVHDHDPQAFAAALLLLAAAGLGASIVPVRRATRVDPMIALRAE